MTSGIYGRNMARRFHVTHKASAVTDADTKAATDSKGDIIIDDTDGKIYYCDGTLLQELS